MAESKPGTGAPGGGGAPGAGGSDTDPTQQLMERLDALEASNAELVAANQTWGKRYNDLRAEFNRRVAGQGQSGQGDRGGGEPFLGSGVAGGGDEELLGLLESDPMRAVQVIGQRLIPQLAPLVDARLRNERIYYNFVGDPGKSYRRDPRFANVLEQKLYQVYSEDPSLSYQQALDKAEPLALEELRSVATILPKEEPSPAPTGKTPPKGGTPPRTRPPETPTDTAEGVGGAGTPGGAGAGAGRQAPPPPDDEQSRSEYLEELEKTRVPGFPDEEAG